MPLVLAYSFRGEMITTAESLEICRYCKGKGWLGMAGNCNLLCESCLGTGLGWVQRGVIISLCTVTGRSVRRAKVKHG